MIDAAEIGHKSEKGSHQQPRTGGLGTPRSYHPALSVKSTDTNCVDGKTYCIKHRDKVIEYFCRNCHVLVCAKCMFQEHNGHELA